MHLSLITRENQVWPVCIGNETPGACKMYIISHPISLLSVGVDEERVTNPNESSAAAAERDLSQRRRLQPKQLIQAHYAAPPLPAWMM